VLGDLVKELFPALGRYLRYHLSRPARRPSVPVTRQEPSQEPSQEPGVAMPESIAKLSDAVGLDPSYLQTVRAQTERRGEMELGVATNPTYQVWKGIPDGIKWTHYFEIYETIFGPRRNGAMRILEIGVFKGNSLRLWKQYFHHPDTVIVGIDIDPTCTRFDAPAEHVHVRIGSQADPEFLKKMVSEFGPFDLIIDDGSHQSTHMIASFNALYADGLKDDGIYFAEDLHANYWIPWRDSRRAFLDLCKELMELMHAHYTKAWLKDWNEETPSSPLVVEVPAITLMIKEIRVFDSVVAIYKTRLPYLPRSVFT
jgi:SAM-dependent methyltransferase